MCDKYIHIVQKFPEVSHQAKVCPHASAPPHIPSFSPLKSPFSSEIVLYVRRCKTKKRFFFLLPLGGISEIKQKSENYKAYSIFWTIIITTFIKKFFSRRTGILWQFNFLYKTVIERHHCSKWQLRHFQMFHEHTGSVTKMTRLVKIKWL